jgi:hypothetical protein
MKKLPKPLILRLFLLLVIAIFGGLLCDEYFSTSYYPITALFLSGFFAMAYQLIKHGR